MIYLLLIDGEENKRKFVVLYEKYRYLMMKVAFDILGNYHDAEDAVHNAFEKVAKNMACVNKPVSNRTKRFLIIITKHVAIDLYRKNRMNQKLDNYIGSMEYCELSVSESIEDLEATIVVRALKELPEKYRDTFLLKYSCGFNNKEIAQIFNITEAAVRKRIVRGKVILQEKMDEIEEKQNESN